MQYFECHYCSCFCSNLLTLWSNYRSLRTCNASDLNFSGCRSLEDQPAPLAGCMGTYLKCLDCSWLHWADYFWALSLSFMGSWLFSYLLNWVWIFRKGIDGINGFSRKTIKLVVMGTWESVMLLQLFLVLIIPIIKPINVYGSGGRRLIHVCYVIIILDVILFSGPLCLYFASYEVARTKPRMTSRDINFHNWVLWWEGSLTFPTHCI